MANAQQADDDLLYRFRSRDALLGDFAELENQTIYFARPEELNDPMDGLTDVFWSGDEVLWENFLRHYAMSFAWYFSGWIMHDADSYNRLPIHGHFCEEDLPTDRFRAICAEIFEVLIGTDEVRRAPHLLAELPFPMRRQGLHTFLLLFHSIVSDAVFVTFKRHNLYPHSLPTRGKPHPLTKVLQAIAELPESPDLGNYGPSDVMELTGQIFASIHAQMHMVFMSDKERGRAGKLAALLTGFPERYIEAIIRDLRHSPWRAACFSREPANASMWGIYAQAHRGAALVFRPKKHKGRRVLTVRGMPGTSPEGRHLEFIRVAYSEVPPTIDFFGSIGRLPLAKLENNWFRTRNGKTSPRLSQITSRLKDWQADQIAQNPAKACWKHVNWRHEAEERLVATGQLFDDPAPSALTYEFTQLAGIVFGMRMTADDRLDIAKMVEKKCREHGRKDFRFFESSYWPTKGAMQVTELDLLQFKGL